MAVHGRAAVTATAARREGPATTGPVGSSCGWRIRRQCSAAAGRSGGGTDAWREGGGASTYASHGEVRCGIGAEGEGGDTGARREKIAALARRQRQRQCVEGGGGCAAPRKTNVSFVGRWRSELPVEAKEVLVVQSLSSVRVAPTRSQG
uniref:Uncharacterized protein n=1 Tax=Oryza glumipatula TaxID=40148 RepID=A0A0E0AI68_9ORYZ